MTKEDTQLYIDQASDLMQKAIDHLSQELNKIRAGKASPAMLDGIRFDYYGSDTPINQAANISTQDAKTLIIQPWDKGTLGLIEKSILAIGLTPMNDGTIIRIVVPSLSEERRKELVKRAKGEAEHAKVSIRNIRRDANEQIKKLQKESLAEDLAKNAEEEIQQLTNNFIVKIDKMTQKKEEELLKV